jgi:hypothetical protein
MDPDLLQVLLVPFLNLFLKLLYGDLRPDIFLKFVLKLLSGSFELFHLICGLLIDKHQLPVLHSQLLFMLLKLSDFLL